MWTPLKNPPPYPAYGSRIVMSDGTVLFKISQGGNDEYGNQWINLPINASCVDPVFRGPRWGHAYRKKAAVQ